MEITSLFNSLCFRLRVYYCMYAHLKGEISRPYWKNLNSQSLKPHVLISFYGKDTHRDKLYCYCRRSPSVTLHILFSHSRGSWPKSQRFFTHTRHVVIISYKSYKRMASDDITVFACSHAHASNHEHSNKYKVTLLLEQTHFFMVWIPQDIMKFL